MFHSFTAIGNHAFANSVDPDETAHNGLIRIYAV